MLFSKLLRIYERRGLHVLSSVAPMIWIERATHKTHPLIQMPNDRLFSYIMTPEGRFCSMGGGLHMTELYLLECLAEVIAPERIFIVGNAFGWSTFAMALAFPDARVVAIDSGGAPGGKEGVEFVNRVAREDRLNVHAVDAMSPQDVAEVALRDLGGPLDLVLIDGDHNNEQQAADFEACRAAASPTCTYLLHDVVNWKLALGFYDIAKNNEANLAAELLTRTASGMGALYPKAQAATLAPVFRDFTDPFAFSEIHVLSVAGLDGQKEGG